MASFLRPISAVYKGKCWIWEILLDNIEQLGFLACVHEEDLSGLENRNLSDGLDIGLAVTDLAKNHLSCREIHERKTDCRRDSAGFTYRTNDILGCDACCCGRRPRRPGWPTAYSRYPRGQRPGVCGSHGSSRKRGRHPALMENPLQVRCSMDECPDRK